MAGPLDKPDPSTGGRGSRRVRSLDAAAAHNRRRRRLQARRIAAALATLYPDARCGLDYRNPYELLVATILSAQCTDARVNQVAPAVFARFPDAHALALARPEEVADLIRSTGFYNAKTAHLLGMAQALVADHDGAVPASMEALTKLPGVGRKTANVVLGNAFAMASGIAVDTHVARLARRLGLTSATDPHQIEADLLDALPPSEWIAINHRLIAHGRQVCEARRPKCSECALAKLCPQIGVSSPR